MEMSIEALEQQPINVLKLDAQLHDTHVLQMGMLDCETWECYVLKWNTGLHNTNKLRRTMPDYEACKVKASLSGSNRSLL